MTAGFTVGRLKAASCAALLIAASFVIACASDFSYQVVQTPTVVVETPTVIGEALTILTAEGSTVPLQAEIAETPEQRAQGLMGRTELAPDSGMLFIIDPPGHGFWMKDTPVSLTVAFIADCGEIVDFADLEPFSQEVKNTDLRYVFALEMERDWFAARGVAAGDVIQLPQRLQTGDC